MDRYEGRREGVASTRTAAGVGGEVPGLGAIVDTGEAERLATGFVLGWGCLLSGEPFDENDLLTCISSSLNG
jgi:hypothetical protein